MIVAVILADKSTAQYFEPVENETLIERLTGTVLRGPFGGTIVASAKSHSARMKEVLHGFAVQHLEISGSGPHSGLSESLNAAAKFRARWEKAMAAAGKRFTTGDDDDDNSNDDNDNPKQKVKSISAKKDPGWAKHSKSPDVKIRGFARSFDRDGVILFRGERPVFRLELQSRVVESFGREATEKRAAARPIAQAVYQGTRGYPVIFSVDAAEEIKGLPASTIFDDWLMQNLARIQDINVDDPAAVGGV